MSHIVEVVHVILEFLFPLALDCGHLLSLPEGFPLVDECLQLLDKVLP